MDKDAILISLTEELDRVEKIARKYLNACVHEVADRKALDHTRTMIDHMQKVLEPYK